MGSCRFSEGIGQKNATFSQNPQVIAEDFKMRLVCLGFRFGLPCAQRLGRCPHDGKVKENALWMDRFARFDGSERLG